MKYYYLFILIIIISGGISEGRMMSRLELNKEQEKEVESLIIASDQEENAIINKISKEGLGMAYHIETISNEKVMPMAGSDQFVMPVLKYGIPGKEPEYDYHNESLRLRLLTLENRKAVILNRSKKLATG